MVVAAFSLLFPSSGEVLDFAAAAAFVDVVVVLGSRRRRRHRLAIVIVFGYRPAKVTSTLVALALAFRAPFLLLLLLLLVGGGVLLGVRIAFMDRRRRRVVVVAFFRIRIRNSSTDASSDARASAEQPKASHDMRHVSIRLVPFPFRRRKHRVVPHPRGRRRRSLADERVPRW